MQMDWQSTGRAPLALFLDSFRAAMKHMQVEKDRAELQRDMHGAHSSMRCCGRIGWRPCYMQLYISASSMVHIIRGSDLLWFIFGKSLLHYTIL